MTRQEAEKLAAIASNIDGGCPVCVETFCDSFNANSFGWLLKYTGDDVKIFEETKQ